MSTVLDSPVKLTPEVQALTDEVRRAAPRLSRASRAAVRPAVHQRKGRRVPEGARPRGSDRYRQVGRGGDLEGAKPGRTVLYRADMDALPLAEETGFPFASKTPGLMHACGHDGHTAVALVMSKLLATQRGEFSGKVGDAVPAGRGGRRRRGRDDQGRRARLGEARHQLRHAPQQRRDRRQGRRARSAACTPARTSSRSRSSHAAATARRRTRRRT